MNYAIDQMMRAAEDADGTIDALREELAEAMAQRDAAVTAHAALAGAVDAVRAAHATATEAGAQYRAAWDAVDGTPPTAAQSEGIAAALRVSYEAQEVLGAALDALLRGAPGGYVAARVVREYRDAAEALLFASYYRARFSAFDDSPDAASAREEETTAKATLTAARTALDAALLAATTTPKEGHGP